MGAEAELRVGVVLDPSGAAAWHVRCVEALASAQGIAVVAAIDAPRQPKDGARRGPTGLWRLFHSQYLRRRSLALAPAERASALRGLRRIGLEDATAFRDLGLDVVVDLSDDAAAMGRDLAGTPVWCFRAPGAPAGTRTVPGFREIAQGDRCTAVVLESTGPDGRSVELGRSVFRTRSHSLVRTLDDSLFGCVDLAVHACRALAAGDPPPPGPAGGTPALEPGPRTIARLVGLAARSFLWTQLEAVLWSTQWNVGVVDAPVAAFADPSFEPTVRWLPAMRASEFRADPFGSARHPAALLVETFDYRTGLGSIVAINEQGRPLGEGPILDLDGHASYPYLVETGGEVFCVPQHDGAGIRLFRARRYPTDWEDAGVLVPGVHARDATLFVHEDRWWLAFTDATRGPMTHLHLWFADAVRGPWRPHATNPVKIDARSSRPAGTPFRREGALYRPAQDCSRRYGGAVAICRVDLLTPTAFSEHVVRVLDSLPGAYGRGVHTVSAWGDRTLVDGQRAVFTLAGSRTALVSRLLKHRRPPTPTGGRGRDGDRPGGPPSS